MTGGGIEVCGGSEVTTPLGCRGRPAKPSPHLAGRATRSPEVKQEGGPRPARRGTLGRCWGRLGHSHRSQRGVWRRLASHVVTSQRTTGSGVGVRPVSRAMMRLSVAPTSVASVGSSVRLAAMSATTMMRSVAECPARTLRSTSVGRTSSTTWMARLAVMMAMRLAVMRW